MGIVSEKLPIVWYRRSKKQNEPATEKRSIPAGVFTKCPACREALLTGDVHKNLDVCTNCGHHFAMATRDRVASIMDKGSLIEHDAHVESVDPLGFRDSKKYSDRVKSTRKAWSWRTGGRNRTR